MPDAELDLIEELRHLSPIQMEPQILELRSTRYRLSGEVASVQKHFVTFDAHRLRLAWATKLGKSPVIVKDTHNKKSAMTGGRDKYAEYVLRRTLEEAGWESRWLDRYMSQIWKGVDTPQRTSDAQLPALVHDIRRNKSTLCNQRDYWDSLSGCWDVVAWRGDQILFVDAKRQSGLGAIRRPGVKSCSGDKINDEQKAWLDAARAVAAIPAPLFAVVEWEKVCPFCRIRICFVPEDPSLCPYCGQVLPD